MKNKVTPIRFSESSDKTISWIKKSIGSENTTEAVELALDLLSGMVNENIIKQHYLYYRSSKMDNRKCNGRKRNETNCIPVRE